ncbi:MAG: phenylalanine--tRNA ligase beta subunit-related protein, partial [Solirubrobacteraceae bacterium]
MTARPVGGPGAGSAGGAPAPASAPAAGFVSPEVRAEFPGLRLHWVTVAQRRRPSPPSLVRRLRELADRYRGAGVIAMRTKPVPHAYRAFFRQIGLDPDIRRIPSEQAAVARLLQGTFHAVDLITDACLVALIETGVPVWALDADAVDDVGLGIRTATEGDAASGHPEPGPAPGSLVVADGSAVHAILFDDPAAESRVGSHTTRVTLFAVAVDGVPAIHTEEALWCAAELLGSPGAG